MIRAKTTIITGMWGPALESYGREFLRTFHAFWPHSYGLMVYSTHPFNGGPRAEVKLLRDCPGYGEFMAGHAGDPEATGRGSDRSRWKDSARAEGYNFRFDAVRFAGQAFIPEAAAAFLPDGHVMCWLDADVVSHAPVPADFIESLLGDADVAFLGREPKHSEIGFWAVRLSPVTRQFLLQFADLYRSDRLFKLKEWHSAYAWDTARREIQRDLGMVPRDLTPGGRGHVWHQSPLRLYLDHLKGNRKARGRSPERAR